MKTRLSNWTCSLAPLIASCFVVSGCGGSGVLVASPAASGNRAIPATSSTPLPRAIAPVASPPPAVVTPRVEARLVATLKTLQKATLGMGKSTAEVEVSNPTPILLNGTVKISFAATGRSEPKVQTRTVSLAPQGRETISFIETSWFVKDAQVEIVTQNGGLDPHAPGPY